jgi:hypothetical protein
MFALGLALKISLAGVGYEERANDSVAIIGAEVTVAAVESAELATGTPRFEDWTADRSVSQLLRQPHILGFAERAEFVPVLLVMFVELFLAAEAGARGIKQNREEQEAGDSGGVPHPTIRSFRGTYFGATISPLYFD